MLKPCGLCGDSFEHITDYGWYPTTERGKPVCCNCRNARARGYHASSVARIDKSRVTIYKLIDPHTDEAFYVGSTRSPLKLRLGQHISSASSVVYTSRKEQRIQQIVRLGSRPLIEALESCLPELRRAKESEWIGILLTQQAPLTNGVNVLPSAHPLAKRLDHRLQMIT